MDKKKKQIMDEETEKKMIKSLEERMRKGLMCGTPMEYEHDRMMAEREKKERRSSSAPVPEEAPKEK